MKNILLILKGIIIGIGKIIPGVSGSIMAISLGVYDRAIECVTSFFDDVLNNFRYLLFLGVGVVGGIIIFSKVIVYLLNNYYIYTMMLFLGLIVGGVRSVYRDSDKSLGGLFLLILGFVFMEIFCFLGGEMEYVRTFGIRDYFVYMVAGMLEGVGTIVPGVSSTALLMIMGVYKLFINSVSMALNYFYVINNISFYLFFGLGLFISIFASIYIVDYLFKRYRDKTFSFILGIIIANTLFLFWKVIGMMELKNLIIGVLLLGIGYIISLCFDV